MGLEFRAHRDQKQTPTYRYIGISHRKPLLANPRRSYHQKRLMLTSVSVPNFRVGFGSSRGGIAVGVDLSFADLRLGASNLWLGG